MPEEILPELGFKFSIISRFVFKAEPFSMSKEGAAVLGILFVTLVVFNHMRIGFLREEYEEWERKYDSDELIRSMRFDHR